MLVESEKPRRTKYRDRVSPPIDAATYGLVASAKEMKPLRSTAAVASLFAQYVSRDLVLDDI
jgi:hypothetical protein